MLEARVVDIQIQPIKGGGALKLEDARMTKAGLARLGVGRWVRPDNFKKEQIMGENWLPMGETTFRKGDIFVFTQLKEKPLQFEK